jgi:hypothetical protein
MKGGVVQIEELVLTEDRAPRLEYILMRFYSA